MDVILQSLWHVVIHHIRYIFDVQTSLGHISGNEDVATSGPEVMKCLVSLSLFFVAVNSTGGQTLVLQFSAE
eukprot:Skav204723  [mRNA]  locus=scaffold1549:175470:175685:- [translate_table: standard]